jgi:uncharacterized protein Smg (DUF494 family)
MEEETTVDAETLESETTEEVDAVDSNEELTKAQELAKNQKIRAEKAEKEAKDAKARLAELEGKSADVSGLSNKDVIFIAKSDIHSDDLDEVLEWAKFKKVDVSEAYKQLKGQLDLKNEQRKTAQATQITTGKRGNTKDSGEELLTRAERTGEVPETTEGMQALFRAKLAKKLS